MRKVCFTNKNNSIIEIIIEPAAEAFELNPQQTAIIEIEESAEFSDSLEIEHYSDSILVHEGRQMNLKIYVEKELVYYTDYP